MELRPYQAAARDAIIGEWDDKGHQRTLLVLPTGTGKTIVFAKIVEDRVRIGHRVLILAHRGELLQQAADKISSATGLGCATEKAEESCIGCWYRVVVGSVQTLMRDKRLGKFPPDYFDTIVVDEAHHALSDSYQRVLAHFSGANVLGVTATPDRGDMRNMGEFFDSLAYEYTMAKAIREGYLSPIKALTIPLKLDLSGVGLSAGDFKASDLGTALDPYLYQIADQMLEYCTDRKTVVFLPLVSTSQKFRDILCARGFRAAEVNGNSPDRAEILRDFDQGKYDVLCNSMLLTEGWDCPTVDCVIVLRPTKVRSLYCIDEETEILTKDGWKKDVSIGEDVASFDVRTSKIIYTPALATVRRKLYADEYFCSLHNPNTDIRVTNKHRMIYDNKRRNGWKIKTAEDICDMADGCYIPISGHGIFNGVPLSDDELRFIGLVMTDGCINKTNGAITIAQAEHQPWLEEIQKCIDGCGFKHNRFTRKSNSQYKSNSDIVVWTISKGAPRGQDKHLRGWGALSPYISKNVSPLLDEMTEDQFAVMLEAINLGDGHKNPWKSYHISNGNKIFIERLQQMGVVRGYRASVSPAKDKAGHLTWTLHIKKQEANKVGGTDKNHTAWTKEPHTNENCWCVETQYGTIVTRRNGKVAIVGNCQMVGRGTRLAPGKDHLLLLDFLWHTERHELCHPASLICDNAEVSAVMTDNIAGAAAPVDIVEAEEQAKSDVMQQREEALAKQLDALKRRKKQLVDPLQYEMSIQAEDLSSYVPAFGWQMGPPSEKQIEMLEKSGIDPSTIECAGKASMLIDRLDKRRKDGLSSPKQIRCLEKYGFCHVGQWPFDIASNMITRIAANGWRGAPRGVDPKTYDWRLTGGT